MTTSALIGALSGLVAEVSLAREASRGPRDGLCAAIAGLIAQPTDEGALLALRRACHVVALEQGAAILAGFGADAALLDAAGRVGAAAELLAEGAEVEARAYAGAALEPLAEQRQLAGRSGDLKAALAELKVALKARLQGGGTSS